MSYDTDSDGAKFTDRLILARSDLSKLKADLAAVKEERDELRESQRLACERTAEVLLDNNSLLHLIARIREAAGDPEGKLMQDELVEYVGKLRKDKERLGRASGVVGAVVCRIPRIGDGRLWRRSQAVRSAYYV